MPLPPELAELADRVSRKTLLWPHEKSDVRAELESHFKEGLIDLIGHGTSIDDSIHLLREQFGDTHTAARLIRRAKKRGRPMTYRLMVWMMCAIAAGGGAAVGYAAWISQGSPNPTVDYMAKINEPVLATPESDRAWPLLAEAILEFTPMPDRLVQLEGGLPQPGEEGWTDAVEWVKANRKIGPALSAALERKRYGFVYDNTTTLAFMIELHDRRGEQDKVQELMNAEPHDPLVPPTIGTLLPSLSEYRQMMRYLILDARLHIANGHTTPAWQLLDQGHALGSLLFDGQTLIEQLVGAAIIQAIQDEMRDQLVDLPLTPELDLALTQSNLLACDVEQFTMNYAGERYFFYDSLQYTFTDDGNGNGTLIPEQLNKLMSFATSEGGVVVTSQHADRKSTLKKFDEVSAAMARIRERPLYDSSRDEYDVLTRVDESRFAMIRHLVPALGRADRSIRELAMGVKAMRVAVALKRYRAKRGRYPDTLDVLVGPFIDAQPVDVYSGNAIRYAATGTGVVLYSVGRDLEDSSGSSEDIMLKGRTVTADIVFWRD